MYYPEEIIEDIRMNNDIVDLISGYIPLKKRGSTYMGLCPFHKENTASFAVNEDKQYYHCFACGAAGNVYTFMMEYESMDFLEALKFLANKASITLPETDYSEEMKKKIAREKTLIEIQTEAARFFHQKLMSPEGKVALSYIKNREFSDKIIRKFGLGYAGSNYDDTYKFLKEKGYADDLIFDSGLVSKSSKMQVYDRFRERITFPIINYYGQIIAFGARILDDNKKTAKYLNSAESPIYHKSKNLYAMNFVKKHKSKELIIVEGYFDLLSMFQAGYTNTLATLGTAFNEEHAKAIKKISNNVLLFFDSDEAGQLAVERSFKVLDFYNIKSRVVYNKEINDPDDTVKILNSDELNKLLKTADSSTVYKIKRIKDRYNLDLADEKIRALKEVSNILKEIESPIELDIYIKESSKIMDIKEDILYKEIEKEKFQPVLIENIRINSKNDEYIVRNDIKNALSSILAAITVNPLIYSKIKDFLQPDMFLHEKYIKIAKTLFKSLDNKKQIFLADLISQFDTVEEQRLVSNIFSNEIVYDDLEQALNDNLKLILEENINLEIKNILTKEEKSINDLKEISKLSNKLNNISVNISLGDD